MAKRTNFEAGGDECDYVAKCMKCKHSFTRQNESGTLFCRLKECRYEERKRNKIRSTEILRQQIRTLGEKENEKKKYTKHDI